MEDDKQVEPWLHGNPFLMALVLAVAPGLFILASWLGGLVGLLLLFPGYIMAIISAIYAIRKARAMEWTTFAAVLCGVFFAIDVVIISLPVTIGFFPSAGPHFFGD